MRKPILLALLALVLLPSVPAAAQTSTQTQHVIVVEQFPGLSDSLTSADCQWLAAGTARDSIANGQSPRVILTGNHGWWFCD